MENLVNETDPKIESASLLDIQQEINQNDYKNYDSSDDLDNEPNDGEL